MDEIYRRMAQMLVEGRSFAVATVTATEGSTPRKAGTKMLVLDDGTLIGTIGGGCGEAQVWQEAMGVLQRGGSRLITVDMNEEATTDTGMICGGLMHIFIERIEPENDNSKQGRIVSSFSTNLGRSAP